MPFDGIVTSGIAYQLNKNLTGGKIEKIYQPDGDELIFHIHSGKERYKLYLSVGSGHARIHFIQNAGSNPQNPMSFCMLLRKHIQGGRIAAVCQKDSERIVEFSIETVNELGFSVSKKLVVEIMGKHSNITLLDATSGKIIDSIKRISLDVNRYRQVLPGQLYVYPPDQGKLSYFSLTEEEFNGFLEDSCHPETSPAQVQASPEKLLVSRIQGISPAFASEIVFQSGSFAAASDLSGDRATAGMYQALSAMTDKLRTGMFSPKVYVDQDGTPVDFHIFPLTQLADFYRELSFDDCSEAAAYYFDHKRSTNRLKQKSTDLVKAVGSSLDKLYLKKQRLSEDLLKAANSDIHRLYGELLTANLHGFRQGDDKVEVLNYYDNTTVTISLDPRFSPSANAQRYYKKYSKAKTAVTEKNIQLTEANKDIDYLESILTYIENALTSEEIEELRQELIESGYLKRRKNNFKVAKSKPAPYPYTTSDGFRILVGRNNKENDLLTLKMASGKDIWFHTKDIPGSHVILFTEGRPLSETAIFEAAGIAAYHSKGKQSSNVPVDYTQVRYVKKPSGAKPGMVIFTDNKTVYVNPSLPTSETSDA